MNTLETVCLLICSCLVLAVQSQNVNVTDSISKMRDKKALSVFQVVKFPNNICTGNTNYNGTCYTATECSSKGGTSAGSCASGFGVCCIFVLACGGSSSDNCTYIVQTTVTTLTSPCNYKICPCSSSICRIRYDFTSFVISDPVTSALSTTVTGTAIGDCAVDQFSITSPGNRGSPTICGFNTGQHMIVDANSQCHQANFNIGSSTATSRFWSIKVTQYACGSEFLGGPPNCLQYFSGTAGTIASYNFLTTATTVSTTATHLSNQCYEICIRRESGMCYICYTPTLSTTTPASFGLSVAGDPAAAIAASSATDTLCTSDYLTIPGGTTIAVAITTAATLGASGATSTGTANRVCGRFFNPDPAATSNVSVCTRQVPFRITVKTDGDEATGAAAINAITNEQVVAPTGNIGFSIKYLQGAC